MRNVFGRDRHNGQAVRAGVALPLSSQNHLEVRNGVAGHLAADAVETEVGHVVLAATVEAAADLDVQVLHRRVHGKTLLGEPVAQFRRQASRRGDAQFARVGAGARDDIHDGSSPRFSQAHRVQSFVDVYQVAIADPTNDEVLFDGRADRLARESPHDVGEGAKLARGDVTQGKRGRDRGIAFLALGPHVGAVPSLESFGGR